MTSEGFDVQTIAQYWFAEAEETLTVADHLLDKHDYSYALFFGRREGAQGSLCNQTGSARPAHPQPVEACERCGPCPGRATD